MAFSGTIERLSSCASTNAELAIRAGKGADAWTVIVAEEQTAGRGRLDRTWFSPGGGDNLYLSVLLRPDIPPARASALSLVTATALAETVAAELGGEDVRVKWPNDLLIGGLKAAGILTELHAVDGRIEWIIIGVGINVNLPQSAFPEELAGRATSLSVKAGQPVNRDHLLGSFLERLQRAVDSFCDAGGVFDVTGWTRWADLGKKVRIQGSDSERVVVVKGVSDDGALQVIDEDGSEHVLIAGDVIPLEWED